jgi:spore coat polysaccharide biosynthesis protein SpsF (cytidylyltransferase family)
LPDSEIVCIIQARLGSSRLPAKVLLPLAGLPTVVFASLRVKRDNIKLIAAVPDNSTNQLLRDCLSRFEIPYFQGSEDKLLDRFSLGLKSYHNQQIIVRITADNFIADSDLIKKIVNEFVERKLNYLSATGPGSGLPIWGTGIEVFRKHTLDETVNNVKNDSERMSVTDLMKKINGNNISLQFSDLNLINNRITIDTFDDYIYANKILSNFDDPINTSWVDILNKISKIPN